MSSASSGRAGRRGRGDERTTTQESSASTKAPRGLRTPTPRVALVIGAALALAVVLYLGRAALTPFLIGLVIVYVLDPPVRWLARRGVPSVVAVLVVYALTVLVLAEGITLLIRPLVDQLIAFTQGLPAFLSTFDEQLRRFNDIYNRLELPPAVRDAVDRALAGLARSGEGFDPTTLLPIARTIAGTVASVFGFLIIPVWAFYILKDRDRLLASFHGALPEPWREDTWAVLRIIERVFGRWLRGQLFLGLVVGAATFLGFLLLGRLVDERFLQFAVLLAVVAGVFELLPIIGPILSAIPAALVALTISPQALIAVLALYIVVQQVENNVLVPKIQGNAIDLHPSIVIFALVIGGAIAGLLGAIFSLPVTAAARDVYRYLFRRLSEEPLAVPVVALDAETSASVRDNAASDETVANGENAVKGETVAKGENAAKKSRAAAQRTRLRAPRRAVQPRPSRSSAGQG